MIDYEKEMIRESDEGFIAGHKKALDELEKWVKANKDKTDDDDSLLDSWTLHRTLVKIRELREKQ